MNHSHFPTPVIVPVIMSEPEPARCPKCERLESIKRLCRHCGYEYPESSAPWPRWKVALTTLLVVATIWFILTAIYWLVQSGNGYVWGRPKSLIEIIVAQWKWIGELRVF